MNIETIEKLRIIHHVYLGLNITDSEYEHILTNGSKELERISKKLKSGLIEDIYWIENKRVTEDILSKIKILKEDTYDNPLHRIIDCYLLFRQISQYIDNSRFLLELNSENSRMGRLEKELRNAIRNDINESCNKETADNLKKIINGYEIS